MQKELFYRHTYPIFLGPLQETNYFFFLALKISLTIVVCTYDAFENDVGIKHRLEEYLIGSFEVVSNKHFSFKYFQRLIALIREISSEYSITVMGWLYQT